MATLCRVTSLRAVEGMTAHPNENENHYQIALNIPELRAIRSPRTHSRSAGVNAQKTSAALFEDQYRRST